MTNLMGLYKSFFILFDVLVHNGRLLTPKSILFPCQIKDLTNNYELISTASKLGHGISYTALQELLTEVAYEKTESVDQNKICLPDNCHAEVFTILVEDNIDRLEETLSGKYFLNVFLFYYRVRACECCN